MAIPIPSEARQDWRVQTPDHGSFTHPDSTWAVGEAGHLWVTRDNIYVAVYAPGAWLFVRGKKEVIHG